MFSSPSNAPAPQLNQQQHRVPPLCQGERFRRSQIKRRCGWAYFAGQTHPLQRGINFERHWLVSPVQEMWVGANARVRMFGGFVILPSHFGVPVASHGGNGEPLHTGCRSPSIDSKHRSAAAPKEYVCRDKNSPCCRQSPSDSRPLAVPCRHVLSHFVPGAYFSSNPVTYGASEQSPAPPVYSTFAHCISNGG